jgi:glycosyltransferase involved in cell wall biosynthesis
MRILTCCYEFPPIGGGGGSVADGLARSLAEGGHAVDLVTSAFRGVARHERAGSLTIRRVPALRRDPYHCTIPEAASYLLPARRALEGFLAAGDYDVVHAHFILPDGLLAWLACKRAGLPFVVTAHGSDVPGYNPDRLRWAHALLGPLWRRVARGAARIVCPSDHLLALVARSCPDARLARIPNGLDAAIFRSDRPRRKRILVASRLLPRKGIGHLMLAIEGLTLDRDLDVAGDGPCLEALRAAARGARIRVTFHGWVPNRSAEYRDLLETSDIFVLPSEAENFPVALLEAMAAGMAIVTTKGTGCAEVVGDAAVLVPPRDPSAIREALVALDADRIRREALGRAARRRFDERFAWPAVAREYASLLEEVASTAHGARP